MTSAREMFENLGYCLIEKTEERVVYRNVYDYIVFETICELVHRYKLADLPGDYKTKLTMALRSDELKAINQQIKELGWNE